jgi:acyl carrier protein
MTREQCIDLISDAYRDFIPAGKLDYDVTPETRLFGRSSPLDSTALVSLLVEVEQRINEQCQTQIVIADDRAVSQERSPFRTIGTLADYLQVLLSEQRPS